MNEHCVQFINDYLCSIIYYKKSYLYSLAFFLNPQNGEISKKIKKGPGWNLIWFTTMYTKLYSHTMKMKQNK
jgi:hypothetical protein